MNTPTVYRINFSTGKLEPIADAGLLPVGAVVTYEDRANPRKRFVVVGSDLGAYGHGQPCICEDGHTSSVSRSDIQGPGGWRDTGEVLGADKIAEFKAAAEVTRARLELEAKQAADHKAARDAQNRQQWEKEFPYLEKAKGSTKTPHALAAANIRRELARAFPGHKFSVRSDSYSGGNSVDVSWELGPTTKDVEAIVNKYERGTFNGMEDIYEYNSSQWPEIYGGVKYVQCHRSEGEGFDLVCAALCDAWEVEKPTDGKSFWNCRRKDDHSGRNITSHARELVMSVSYPAGAVLTGITECEERDGAPGFARYYLPTFTAPQLAPTPEPEPAHATAPAAGVVVQINTERGGLEIRFPAKPAEAVLSMMKRHGWRWTRFGGCWYHRATAENLSAAAQIANLTDEQRQKLAAQIEDEHHRAGAMGMEIACGIS